MVQLQINNIIYANNYLKEKIIDEAGSEAVTI